MKKLKFLSYIGLDKAIFFTVLQRGWSGVAGFVTITLMMSMVTPIEQGYYYTFSSLFALQIFFELGFFYVLTQMVAHEHAIESIDSEDALHARNRLGALVRMSIRWYIVIALLFFVCVSFGGWFFFSLNESQHVNISWRLPWFFSVFLFSIGLISMPIIACFEGCGKVAEVSMVRLAQDIVGYVLFWVALVCGFGLNAVPLLFLGRILVVTKWIFSGSSSAWLKKYLEIGERSPDSVSWKRDIFPLQWKMALSWLSGYFIFNLFTPVIFAYQGAAEAGRMGMTLSIFTGISGISLAWLFTKVPRLCGFIALKQFGELNVLFRNSFFQSVVVSILGITTAIAGIAMLTYFAPAARARIVDFTPLIFLAFTFFINHVVGGLSVYLRAFKEEPFLTLSIIMGLSVGLSTFLLGKYSGVQAVSLGYVILTLFISLPFGTHIFLKKYRNPQQKI